MLNIITNFKYLNIIKELVHRDLKKKYRGSILGIIWTVLNPLLMMTVMTIVFSNLFRFNIANFPLYLITGQVIFNFFSESTNIAMVSIIGNAPLIKKIYIKKSLFPLSGVAFSFINTLFSIIAIFIIILVTKSSIGISFLLIPILLVYLFIFSYGIGMILSVIAVYFRDIMHLYSIFLMILMYLTPIFYPIEIIPEKFRWLIDFNFMSYYVKYFRTLVYEVKIPDIQLNLICLTISIVFFIIGKTFFKLFENKLVLEL